MEMLLEYRNAHNSVVYWKMLELINGEDSEYTLGNIEAAIMKYVFFKIMVMHREVWNYE